MFYSQPLSTRFGTNLIDILQTGIWNSLDIAVAWVRASGIAHLEPALTGFLKAGRAVRITVGVDLDNTTKEGLANLLALQQHGAMSIFVHHNEAGTIFHPKLYLFQNATHAKLIVGSNNITEAGLYQNTEAGLELELDIENPIIVSAKNALDAWRDTTSGIARQLDAAFLDDLVSNGYVTDEASLKAEMASRRKASKTKSKAAKKLFKSVTVTPPPKPTPASSGSILGVQAGKKKSASASTTATSTLPSATSQQTGQALLMRVRTARGTQVQIPIREAFFSGVTQVYSVATGVQRGIHATYPDRDPSKPNTLKLEMPETKGMVEPVARFERTPTGMQFEVYDSSSPQGQLIMQALEAGKTTNPPVTKIALPSAPDRSTWWRVI